MFKVSYRQYGEKERTIMITVTATTEYATAATKVLLDNIDIIDVIRFHQHTNKLEITAYTNTSTNNIKYAKENFSWDEIFHSLIDKNWRYIDGDKDIFFFNPKK